MESFKGGLRNAFRRRKSFWTVFFLACLVTCGIIFCQWISELCTLLQQREENPYTDYYRLVVDYTDFEEIGGYTSKDRMSCHWWHVREIHSYVQNIVDYTAELTEIVKAEFDVIPAPGGNKNEDIYVQLYALTDCIELSDFAKGNLSLLSGRLLTERDRRQQKNVCVISEELADLNAFSVGDLISVRLENDRKQLEIVGIYRDHIWRNEMIVSYGYSYQANRIYVPLSFCEENGTCNCYNYQIKLDDDSLIDEVEAVVNRYGMAGGYPAVFIRVSDLFAEENKEVHIMRLAAEMVQIVFAAVIFLLLTLVLMSDIHARRRELGIYLSMGAGRQTVIGMLLTEYAVSFFSGMAAAFAVSACCSKPVLVSLFRTITEGNPVGSIQNTTSDLLSSLQIQQELLADTVDMSFLFRGMLLAGLMLSAIALTVILLTALRVLRLRLIRLVREAEN